MSLWQAVGVETLEARSAAGKLPPPQPHLPLPFFFLRATALLVSAPSETVSSPRPFDHLLPGTLVHYGPSSVQGPCRRRRRPQGTQGEARGRCRQARSKAVPNRAGRRPSRDRCPPGPAREFLSLRLGSKGTHASEGRRLAVAAWAERIEMPYPLEPASAQSSP